MSDQIGEPVGSRIPASFKAARWVGTLPVDEATGRVGLTLGNEGGETFRFSLDLVSALDVVATLADALSAYQRKRSHSETSEGMPSRAGSTPPGSENV